MDRMVNLRAIPFFAPFLAPKPPFFRLLTLETTASPAKVDKRTAHEGTCGSFAAGGSPTELRECGAMRLHVLVEHNTQVHRVSPVRSPVHPLAPGKVSGSTRWSRRRQISSRVGVLIGRSTSKLNRLRHEESPCFLPCPPRLAMPRTTPVTILRSPY